MEQPSTLHWTPPAAPVADSRRAEPRSPVLNVVLLAVTVLTTTVAGTQWLGLDTGADPTLLARGLPFAVTLVTILLVHEFGHYFMCLRHRVSASLPYFLPAPPQIFPLGTFGAFIRIRSRFPDRRALFDVGAAGPWAGFVVALAATVVGLARSDVVPTLPDHHGLALGDSILFAFLSRLVLHADDGTILLHPVALAGWFGLFVTSLNLIPVGQLDGGHVLYAAAGRVTRLIPVALIGSLVWLGMSGWPGWLVWAVIIAVLHSIGHPATDDDRQPLGPGRLIATVATLVVLVLTFVPEPFRLLP